MSFIDRKLTAALALLLALVVAGPAFAAAKSVTLLGVSGPGGDKFARGVETDLADLYDLVPGDVYRSMAERMGRRGASPGDVQAVASKLRIDAVVGGAIVGQGRARHLLIAVREGSTGRVLARGRYDLGGRTLPLIRERVVSDLVRVLERVRPVQRGGAPVASSTPEQEEPAETPSGATSVGNEPDTTSQITETAPARTVKTIVGVSAGVGPSLLTRHFSFDLPTAPSYQGGTVAGVRVEGAVFPLALSAELAADHPVLASFGIAGSFENIFNFTSSTGVNSATGSASRWSVVFLGRIPLGHNAVGGHLTVETGWQQLNYASSSPMNIGVPNVSYGMVDAGLDWQKSLGTKWLALDLRLAYLGLLQAGDLVDPTNYGRATGWGLSSSAGLTTTPLRWLWINLRGSYDFVALTFAGSGQKFAHSSADHWIGGALEVGFAL